MRLHTQLVALRALERVQQADAASTSAPTSRALTRVMSATLMHGSRVLMRARRLADAVLLEPRADAAVVAGCNELSEFVLDLESTLSEWEAEMRETGALGARRGVRVEIRQLAPRRPREAKGFDVGGKASHGTKLA
jgi:hypothetical protein